MKKDITKLDGCIIYKQDRFLERRANSFDTSTPLYITDITNDKIKEVKDKITYFYGDVEIEESEGEIFVTPKDLFDKTRYGYSDLVEIIRRLRDPDGCPWDKVQTPQSIRTNILEEAYELIEAIDLNSPEKIREEAGDVMLQSVFVSCMTESTLNVSNVDIITELCHKLITRHTHIFGKDKAKDAKEALYFWEKAKTKEKGQKGIEDKLDSVPVTFTALQRANKVQKIIKKTGFDFPTKEEALAKIYEEIKEFTDAEDKDKEKEAGDMLFSVVNVLRLYDIDPELALNGTTTRFEKRFRYVLQKSSEDGKNLQDMTLDDMEKYYQESKNLYK